MEPTKQQGRGRGRGDKKNAAGAQPNWKQSGGGDGAVSGSSSAGAVASSVPAGGSDGSGAGNGARVSSSITTVAVPRGEGAAQGGRGAIRSKRYIPEVVVTRQGAKKQGVSGQAIKLQANYFRLVRQEKSAIFQYRIDFEPPVEDTGLMHALLKTQAQAFGPYIYEGTILFLYNCLKKDEVELQVKDDRTGNLYKLRIRFVGTVDMTSEAAMMVLNLLHRQALASLKLLELNRHYFDPVAKISIPEFNLELYPGYITSIRQHEKDVLLCVDVTHRVVRTDTVYARMAAKGNNTEFAKEVIGSVVMCVYNQKTYKISDVDWNTTPSSTFTKKDGTAITFLQYFQDTYNRRIRDPKQPMLVSTPTMRQKRAGILTPIYLVPELCQTTGITDDMRKDMRLMRTIADHTRIGADKRIERLERFNNRLNTSPASREVFTYWKTELDRRLVELPARVLGQEQVFFGGERSVPSGPEADWTHAFRENRMFKAVPLQRWHVICEQRSERTINDFIGILTKVSVKLGFQIAPPQFTIIPRDHINMYQQALSQVVNQDPQLIMCVVSTDSADRYTVIKKRCCVDHAIPTQVIKSRTITPKNGNPGSLMSVGTKVAIQMTCKIGGIPWLVKNPLTSVMIVGFDVCNDTKDKSKSYGALVATMYAGTQKEPAYFSSVEHHSRGEELSNFISTNITKALRSYQSQFGPDAFPRRVIIYRDGVGDGQLTHVVEHEVQTIKARLTEAYKASKEDIKPQMAVLVVSKRINTRLFIGKSNPKPGTVVDDVITLPERSDFFLVSQSVRQGTVAPTSYNIIFNESGLTSDQLQVYSNKQTLLYYNWSGAVRVPAVCQYAHKLAFLVSQYIKQQPHEAMEKRLYYL
ncbi:protein aubergine-like [Anopheles bellator]|uniref:protein aubergine-like n=1 Tax=Anopheles bellator TaxID=139047 RepID=UPI002649CB13|nr:protein aubergine-like [Anopheles bellator]XP_058053390.1 protein aubergine-like [Anopheles bellator]